MEAARDSVEKWSRATQVVPDEGEIVWVCARARLVPLLASWRLEEDTIVWRAAAGTDCGAPISDIVLWSRRA